jgi:hypothetical protein
MVVVACGSDGTTARPSSTGEPTPTEGSSPSVTASATETTSSGPPTYDAAGCPVADEAFCATAVDAIAALQAGDAHRLFELSRADRLVCADVNQDYFPGCEEADVLEGHGLSGPTFIVDVLGDAAYRRELEGFVSSIDPSFEDELGNGDVRILGVGTCGPDIPGRRTYHLAYTAAGSERLLGSFELTFDEDWRIALWYLGPLAGWEEEQPPDPMSLAFCEAGRSPWSS